MPSGADNNWLSARPPIYSPHEWLHTSEKLDVSSQAVRVCGLTVARQAILVHIVERNTIPWPEPILAAKGAVRRE